MIHTQEVGIHIGYSKIAVSRWRLDRTVQFTCEVSSRIAITNRGEVLLGSRSEQYQRAHKDATLFSLLSLFEEQGWKDSASFLSHGRTFRLCEIFLQTMKDLHAEALKELKEEGVIPCVVSISTERPDALDFLRRYLAKAGFHVLRILCSSAACSLYHRVNYLADLTEEDSAVFSAVEGDTAFVSRVEMNADGIQEILSTSEMSRGDYMESYPEKYRDEKIFHYIDPSYKSHFSGGERLFDITKAASRGAAVQAQKLANGHGFASELLLLDATGLSYSIQMLNAAREPLQEPIELIESQTTIPVKASCSYVLDPVERKEAFLRIITRDSGQKNVLQIADLKVSAIFSAFNPEHEAEIEMELDENRLLTVTLAEQGTKNHFTKNIGFTYESELSVPESRQWTGQQIRELLSREIRQFQNLTGYLDQMEQELNGTEKGLVMIRRSCEAFAQKNLAIGPDDGTAYFENSALQSLAQEWIELLDQMEYGLSGISEMPEERAQKLLIRTYGAFQRCAELCLHLERIPAEGMTFDPHVHHAVSYEAAAELKDDEIIEELQTGYLCSGQLLRPSKVRVAKGEEAS